MFGLLVALLNEVCCFEFAIRLFAGYRFAFLGCGCYFWVGIV